MKHILNRGNLKILAEAARSNVLLAFDFDGTLAPIVSNRGEAAMRASTRRLLAAACKVFPTAIISGRGRRDLKSRLLGVPVAHVVGNHGMEPARDMERFESSVRRLGSLLDPVLSSLPGIEIEDKRYSLSIHYRKATRKRDACRTILAAVAALPGRPRVLLGKMVVNLLPNGAPHKGTALDALRVREAADKAIFVGDDVTDEDVFASDGPAGVLGIRVGRSTSSAAAYYVRDQHEVDELLLHLIRFRTPCP